METKYIGNQKLKHLSPLKKMNNRGENMNMIIGSNGFAVESTESNVVIIYDPSKKQVDIRSGTESNPVSLSVEGKIFCNNGELDVICVCDAIRDDILNVKRELAQLRSMMEEIYYAPDMPGFTATKEHFAALNGGPTCPAKEKQS